MPRGLTVLETKPKDKSGKSHFTIVVYAMKKFTGGTYTYTTLYNSLFFVLYVHNILFNTCMIISFILLVYIIIYFIIY